MGLTGSKTRKVSYAVRFNKVHTKVVFDRN